ncbi:MAG: outer membrane lipid asymmetry maintenance protein MlaD [Rickettsiaceae bacterium]|nr:outer membrane lipid asymmetry maintenance protein MlaD [Rickettsiaceae bacterium]MDP5020776.1 outer membrane lipid asymmetry maintenance protein MlaD [Rickettsiaceae bacterium]MDP5083308.1 outer membrane lipid asymmetry maintenance protein MlaD [Rickettsiaceae bacterium]
MKQGVIETLVGLLVLVVAFGFLVFAYNVSNVSKTRDGYNVVANFQDIDGISEGADVKLAGIKIGYVDSVLLDSDTYYAGVRLYIDKKIEIPEDSRAVVATSGLLGGKYIRISPGGSEDNLSNEGKIKFTQSSLNIEDLIGKLMYSLTSK